MRNLRRVATAIVVLTLTGAPLTALSSPASAEAVFSTLTFSQEAVVGHSPNSCTRYDQTTHIPETALLSESGAPVTDTASTTQKWMNSNDDTESATVSAAATASASASTRAGLPATVTLRFSGSASMATDRAAFACGMTPSAIAQTDFAFTISRPLLATLSYQATGATYNDIYLQKIGDEDRYADLTGRRLNGSGSITVYLAPGQYSGYLEGDVALPRTTTSVSETGSGTSQIRFAVPGEAAAAPTGTATRLVTLPTGRNCAGHNATARLTTSAKRLKPVRQISFALNGRTVRTIKGTALTRGRVVPISVPDHGAATISVTARTRAGTVQTARATYLSCT